MSFNGCHASNDQDKAELISSLYLQPLIVTFLVLKVVTFPLQDIVIDDQSVYEGLCNLDITKAAA